MTRIRFAPKTLQGDFPAKEMLNKYPWLNHFVPKQMRESMPDWFRQMKPSKNRYSPDVVRNIKTCPSFINLMQNGYLLCSQADILVDRGVDGETRVVSNLEPILPQLSKEYSVGIDIEHHDNRQFGEFFPHENGFLHASIKFTSPFMFVPEGYVDVLFIPCWWHKEYKNVRAFHGMFSQDADAPTGWEVNTMIREPEIGESYCIPAGTPLAQIICCNVVSANFEYVEDEKTYKKYFQKTIANRLGKMTSTYSKAPIDRIKSFLLKGAHNADK